MKFERLPEVTEPVAERLRVSLDGDLAILRGQVSEKQAQLWECDNGDAYMITKTSGTDLVICCYEGKNVKHAVPHLIAAAKEQGLKSLRFHTKRPSLARLLKDYKPELSETIYRIPF